MKDDKDDFNQDDPGAPRVNPGYASFQIAKALTTSEEHVDPATRERAVQRIAKWKTVLHNILSGLVNYGSRTPVANVPAWATLEVVTGGFATGRLRGGGDLQEHEKRLLESISGVPEGAERRVLNSYFLTEAGLVDLQEKLRTGCYDVAVAEEGALLVVAWLVENGFKEEARAIISELSPYFDRLRFFPVPLNQPRRSDSKIHLQDVGATIEDVQKIRPNIRILAQKEASNVWAPWYDNMVALFLETVVEGWPCRQYPETWPQRALALLGEFAELRKEHKICGKPERAGGYFAQLREFLGRCARAPESLTGREVGRIRLILNKYVAKRGVPNSPACVESRRRQAMYVSGPTFHALAGAVVPRLEKHYKADGVDSVDHLQWPIDQEEAEKFNIPKATPIPPNIQQKIERCLNGTPQLLVERGLITSGETLAKVLPQMISGLRSAAISDPALGQLYAAIYRAFRRRRSLLLLNLEKQVQVEELPWVSAIDQFRTASLSDREISKQELKEVTVLTLTSFPHAILPNKLLQELRALAKGAKLDIVLVDEVAADIFMGRFSGKFPESASRAAKLLGGTLYSTYYGIDYEQVAQLSEPKGKDEKREFGYRSSVPPDPFATLCASRAGVELGGWDTAINGMIIEQQQILTSQNLAELFASLDLRENLRTQLQEMAQHCFVWICKRLQVKVTRWHAGLIMLKNTAYAWRQMIFYLSLLEKETVHDFISWAIAFLDTQPEEFRNRFRPALNGLVMAAEGRSVDEDAPDALRFLGWSNTRHWLMPHIAKQIHR